MSDLEISGKVKGDDGAVSFNKYTKIQMPLYLQIMIIVFCIVITATVVKGYTEVTGSNTIRDNEIKTLQETKLDKTEYQADNKLKALSENDIARRLKLIMDKLKIEDY